MDSPVSLAIGHRKRLGEDPSAVPSITATGSYAFLQIQPILLDVNASSPTEPSKTVMRLLLGLCGYGAIEIHAPVHDADRVAL